jgi:hypothetical protein
MTEPQKIGVEEVMRLVGDYGMACQFNSGDMAKRSAAGKAVRLALTAIIAERDASVEESRQLVRALEAFTDASNETVRDLLNERDALAIRVKELEEKMVLERPETQSHYLDATRERIWALAYLKSKGLL